MWWVLSCAFWILCSNRAGAQALTWDDFLDKITDQESDNYTDLYNYYDDLCYLHEHPIHINSATTEVLKQLPFLNAQQIEEIEAYVYSYGPIRSVGELNLIPYLDYDTRQFISLFITFDVDEKKENKKLSFNSLGKYGKHDVLLRTDIPFTSMDEKYLGSSLYHSIRYQFKYANRVEWGFTAEKDSGEPILKGVNNWFDNYNYYLIIKNIGLLKTLALGDYRLKFGQGIVLNSQFTAGKSAMLSHINTYSDNAITKHSSTNENNYFQGAAAQFAYKNWQLYTFISYKQEDATLTDDMLISTLKTDGYHRTISEYNKKNNISNLLIGYHLSWNKNDFHIGFTSTNTFFNKSFKSYPNNHYKYYNPVGSSFGAYSIDYSYISYKFTFSGETAMDNTGSMATLNSIQWRPSSLLKLNLVHRYYDKRFNSLFGSAFSESSHIKNEHGIYLGMVYQPLSKLKTTAYIDVCDYPFLKYLVSALHTKSMDAMGQLDYTTNKKVTWLLKYRLRVKQQNYKNPLNEKQVAIANRITQTGRLQAKYSIGAIEMSTQINYSQFNLADKPAEIGYAFSQQCILHCNKPNIQWSIMGTYFNTDSYETRIYSYEKGLLYSFSFPSYYGNGYRLSSLLRYDISKKIMIMLKYGHTQYFDVSKQKKDNLQVQLRVKI